MKKVFGILSILVLVTFLFVVTNATEKENAQSLYEQGYQLFLQSKWTEAIADFDRAIEIEPTHLLAWCYKGTALNRLGNWDESIAAFDSALKLDKACIYAFAGKAEDLNRLNRDKELDILIKETLQIQPKQNNALDYLGRGLLYSMMVGKGELAIADYTAAIKINPNDAVAYYHRGLTYADQKKDKQAMADLNSAIRIYPKYATAYLVLGFIDRSQGKYKRAVADFTAVIKINPESAWAYYHRGLTYTKIKNYKAARKDFEKTVALQPTASIGQAAQKELQKLREMGY
jgi:tetratricopeptide (TPR) repeat protein